MSVIEEEIRDATIAELLTFLELPEELSDNLEHLTKEVMGFLFAIEAWIIDPEAQSRFVAERLQHYATAFSILGECDKCQVQAKK